MAEGVNGGPARFYRRRSLAEQREAFQIASAEVAVLEARADQVSADAEVRINKLDLQILKADAERGKGQRKEAFPTGYKRNSRGPVRKRTIKHVSDLWLR